jgi:hypothetical protein
MPVDVTVALENLTMGDLYRFVDFARAARLPATAQVKQVTDDEGERIVALTATVSGGETAPRPAPTAPRPAPRRTSTNVAGAVGEAVGYIDDLRRKFNTPPSG